MDFVSVCIESLKKSEDNTAKIYGGKTYFPLSCMSLLPGIVHDNGTIGDLVITPYYFFDEHILELYDYALSIRIVKNVQSKERFFLSETGKRSLKEIDPEILEKLDNTYYEALEGDNPTFLKSLERYLGYMKQKEAGLLDRTRNDLKISSGQWDGIFYELI